MWSNNYKKAVVKEDEEDTYMTKLMKWLPGNTPHGTQPSCESQSVCDVCGVVCVMWYGVCVVCVVWWCVVCV